jgi:hypothetical protein
METLSRRITTPDSSFGLNLHEYAFLTKCIVAWTVCAPQNAFINEANISTCAK